MDRDNLLQPPLQGDARMEALARLIARLSALPADVPLVNLFDLVDASALASLGEQFHVMGVEGWNLASTEAARRALLKKAIELHRHKGTPWAVEEALRATGFAGAEVREGGGLCAHDAELAHNGAGTYASGNRWAMFDIEINLGESAGIDAAGRARIRETVNAWKNARSHLRALSWRTSAEDSMAVSETPELAARADFPDVFAWGFPTPNGEIRYNNGFRRQYDGELAHDGTARHDRWLSCGRLHDNQVERLETALAAVLDEVIRFRPLHDGLCRHDGTCQHGPGEDFALEETVAALKFGQTESIRPAEEGDLTVSAEGGETVGRYHDGSFSHGQRQLFVRNGLRFYDGSLPHGTWNEYGGGKEVRGVRHDGLCRHDGSAGHTLWGWLAGSAHAPDITYQALADLCAASAGMTAEDALPVEESAGLALRRYLLRRGAAFYDGAQQHVFREDSYAL